MSSLGRPSTTIDLNTGTITAVNTIQTSVQVVQQETVDNKEYLEPHLFDAMFIPFVGVDVNGFRIGYGGGYFDRALTSLIGSNQRKPLIIGLGYDYQILSKNLAEPHDLRYHNVVTESRILSYN